MNTPKNYRKKPVVIQAMRMAGDTADLHGVYKWVEGRKPFPESGVSIDPRDGRMIIATLEGLHWVDLGDWVIRGVAGEFHPCKAPIFSETYEQEDQP